MNNFRLATFRVLRAYATKANAGMRKRLVAQKRDNDIQDEFEELEDYVNNFDESNLMEVTSDFINSNRAGEMARQQLRQQIVKHKVFKESLPRFLTLAEIEQMKKLHESDPEEWTPEKLSESFPALPRVVKKVLNIKWSPKTAEAALYYDKRVIENWKRFKIGKLVVPPELKEHLMKFRNRKIELMDRETMEKRFVPAKIEFPKPKSTFFSCILQDSVNQKTKITDPKKLISSPSGTDKDAKNLIAGDNRYVKKTNKNYKAEEKLVFAEFLKKKLSNLDKVSVEERVALVETYRKETEPKNVDVSLDMSNAAAEDTAVEEKRITTKPTTKNSSDALAVRRDEEFESKAVIEVNADHASLDTFVKERISYMDTNFEYTKHIRIPRSVYEKGMTYRIKDCYYDYDGEFLYRVPGLKN